MRRAFSEFHSALRKREAVAGIFVLSESISLPSNCSAEEQFTQCAKLIQSISDVSVDILINGGRFSKVFQLVCPITLHSKLFDDFDAIAFCPQALNSHDDLYDPMMGAPVPCINFSSDIYAFAMFTRDISLQSAGKEVRDLTPSERNLIFHRALERWQKFAAATIRKYMSITDLTECPVSLGKNEAVWFANHQDPAFAEREKCQFSYNMSVIYAPQD